MIEEKTLTLTWYWNLSGKDPCLSSPSCLYCFLTNSKEAQTLVFGSSRTWWGVCDEEKTVLMSVYVFSVLKSPTLRYFFSHAKLKSQFWWTTKNKFEGNSISDTCIYVSFLFLFLKMFSFSIWKRLFRCSSFILCEMIKVWKLFDYYIQKVYINLVKKFLSLK